MDHHSFCFIICTSDPLYIEECLTYIEALDVPEGYNVDTLTIEGAMSMCAGYNAGMKSSDARYKIYMHQDVFIQNRAFLHDLLKIFADPTIGMIGMVGTQELSQDAVMWNGNRVGAFPGAEAMVEKKILTDFEVLKTGMRDVMAVDGLLIATQADLPWREDLFTGWDFYDIAQAMEFRRAGYRIVVCAQQPDAWYLHDTVTIGLENYDHYRKIFLQEYGKELFGDGIRKRILFPLNKEIQTWDIPYALKLLGIEPLLTKIECQSGSDNRKDVDALSRILREQNADAVMTHDFSPFVAKACDENDLPYIAWIWDAPNEGLYDDSVRCPGNYIFDFDSAQAKETISRGGTFIRYMPLAVNTHAVDRIEITEEDIAGYSCDISFVGSLYSDPSHHIDVEKLHPETVMELQTILRDTTGCWDGTDHISGRLSEKAVTDISSSTDRYLSVRRKMGERRYIEDVMIPRHAAYEERQKALRLLAKQGNVRLYTNDEERHNDLAGVKICGRVSYRKETPKVYYLSKINLNLTLHSIRTGVPIRVLDIMSAGGFVLTNYQSDLTDMFDIGTDLEVFHSFEELEDKAVWYLNHEDQRLRIALNGCRKVQEQYSYERQTKRILEIVSKDLEEKGKPGLI